MSSPTPLTSEVPPGYSLEDLEARGKSTWYAPGKNFANANLIVTDQFVSSDSPMSPPWQSSVTALVIARYRAGYPYCHIRHNGTEPSAGYHTALQNWLRETYDFPGKFGTTVFGVRVLFAPNTHTILMHIPFVIQPR